MTERWKRYGPIGVLAISVGRSLLDAYGRIQAAVDIKASIPVIFAKPWVNPLVIAAGFAWLYFATRNPLVIPGIVDRHGNSIAKKQHQVLRYGFYAIVFGLLLAIMVGMGLRLALKKGGTKREEAKVFMPIPPAVVQPPSSADNRIEKQPISSRQPALKKPEIPSPISQSKAIQPTMRTLPNAGIGAPYQQVQSTLVEQPPKGAYADLGSALEEVKRLDERWRSGSQEGDGVRRPGFDMHGMPLPEKDRQKDIDTMRNDAIIRRSNLCLSIANQWYSIQPKMDLAVKEALQRMSMPGKAQLSPHAQAEKREAYSKFQAQAAKGPTNVEIGSGKLDPDRFAPFASFIDQLYRELGDYSENPPLQ